MGRFLFLGFFFGFVMFLARTYRASPAWQPVDLAFGTCLFLFSFSKLLRLEHQETPLLLLQLLRRRFWAGTYRSVYLWSQHHQYQLIHEILALLKQI